MTPDQIRDFQRWHKNHLGRPLLTTGELNAETEWALNFATLTAARRDIVTAAQEHLGLVEDPPGSNRDPAGLIEAWLRRAGAMPGDPWCASFASKCLGSVKMAGAQQLGRHFPAVSDPCPGDIFWYVTTGVHGHCGLVTGLSASDVMTIEGNSDNAVRCLRRPRVTLRFSRVLPDTSGTWPGVVPSVPLSLSTGGTR